MTDPRHEVTAQYFATPTAMRNVRSVTELAQRIGVTRKTVYEWLKDPDVALRAAWLSAEIRVLGDLEAQREWFEIVHAVIRRAKAGNTKAARFIQRIAWPEDRSWCGRR